MIPGARTLRRRALLAVFCCALQALACRAGEPTETPEVAESPEALRIGVTERSIAPGDRHRYALELSQAQALVLELEQGGVDLILVAEGPGGEPLAMDNPREVYRPETLTWIARHPGQVVVEVEAPEGEDAPGSYRLRVAPPRAATREDFAANRGFRRYQAGQEDREAERFVKARREFAEAAGEFRKSGDARTQAWAWHKVGGVSKEDLRDPEWTELAFRRAVVLERRAGGGRALSSALYRLASALVDARRRASFYEAVALYQEAREILETLGIEDREHELRLLAGEATAQSWIGRTHTAIGLYDRAIVLARSIGDPARECEALFGLARALRRVGDLEGALRACDECLQVPRGLTDEWRATILGEMAGLMLDLDRPDEALEYLENAEAAAPLREIGSRQLHDRARAYGRLGRFREAEQSFLEALELVHRRAEEAVIQVDRAYVRAKAGDHEAARDLCREVLEQPVEGAEPLAILGAHHCLARAFDALGDGDRALRHIQAAVGRMETIRDGLAQDRLRSLFLASRREYYELYVRLLLQKAADPRPGEPTARWFERAFEVAEASKSRTFLDGLKRAESEVGQDLGALERKAALEEEIAGLELRLLVGQDVVPPDGATLAELDRKHAELDRIRGELRAGTPGWREALSHGPAGIAEIRAGLLADGTTQIVSYLLGEDDSFVWVVGQDSIIVERLEAGGALERLAERVALSLATAKAPHQLAQARRNAAALSRRVLAPITHALDAPRLVMIPEGALEAVPFAALPLGEGPDAPYLSDQYEIVQAYSASTALALSQTRSWRPSSNQRIAIVADPIYQCTDDRLREAVRCTGSSAAAERAADAAHGGFNLYGLPRLEATREEARELSSLAGDRDPLTLLDFEARAGRLLEGHLAEFEFVHLATHGFSEHGASGLVFSNFDDEGRRVDGVVREWQVYDLSLAADLVVLSACRSGSGERLTGEGSMSLARAFLWAGASTVLVSLWDVDDRATAALMERFYTGLLLEQVPPGEALRRAQDAVRSRPQWAAPRYWAGFVIQGDWR